MTDAATPQRRWRAACPQCGAPVEFASAASASAVCSFCRSTLLREGEALRRIGQSAELFDDHSPLQLGTSGRHQGEAFTLIGRLQLGSTDGALRWTEWHALFNNGRSGWLAEDNGAHVFGFDAPLPDDAAALPALATLATLVPGQAVALDGRRFSVASVVATRLLAAEGELPQAPPVDGTWTVVDLRSTAGEVATLESRLGGRWSLGRAVQLPALQLQGLKDADAPGAGATLASRVLACPSCGAPLQPTLASTQTITCGQCAAVVDISAGAGADLAHYAQTHGADPQIPLGRTGTLALAAGGQALPWQVVGYVERCDIPAAADDDEVVFWREYLLYNRLAGFAFLVDANDGWSLVQPITGVPDGGGRRVVWSGLSYTQRDAYAARNTWVIGEFYWRLQRDAQVQVTDYASADGRSLLSREADAGEVTWSAGRTLGAGEVARAFALKADAALPLARDATATGGGRGLVFWVLLLLAIVLLVSVMRACSGDECDGTRQAFGEGSAEYAQCQRSRGSGAGSGYGRIGGGGWGGGSGGGFGGGGGHK